MAAAGETLQATLSESGYRALKMLAESVVPLSGRAATLRVPLATANNALSTLAETGLATSEGPDRTILWQLAVSNALISAWLEE
jgi:DNA-binding IclR family transcriptional regulator